MEKREAIAPLPLTSSNGCDHKGLRLDGRRRRLGIVAKGDVMADVNTQ
jgi:hypothetical protein